MPITIQMRSDLVVLALSVLYWVIIASIVPASKHGIYNKVFTMNLNQGEDCKMALLLNILYISVSNPKIINIFSIMESVEDDVDGL